MPEAQPRHRHRWKHVAQTSVGEPLPEWNEGDSLEMIIYACEDGACRAIVGEWD